MKRDEYLSELRLTLQNDGFEQVEEAIAWFDEMLQDRMSDTDNNEEEAVAAMEPPQSVARALREGAAREKQGPGAQGEQKTSGASGEADKGKSDQKPVFSADGFIEETGSKAHAPAREDGAPGGEHFTGVKVIRFKADQARHIRVRDRNTGVIVTGVDGDEIVLRHPQSDRIRYDFTLEDGRMSLIRQPIEFSLTLLRLGFLSSEMTRVTLEVPKELAAELDLSTSNAGINISDVNCWGQIRAASSNGGVTLTDVSAKAIDLKTGNARLALERVRSAGTITAVTSNGRAIAQGVESTGPLTLKTSNGAIHAHSVKAPAVSLVTSNGGIEVEGVHAQEITLATSNSSVKGTLPGSIADWDVTSQTSNGKSTLPSRKMGGANKLNVRTSNASIKLAFDGDGGTGA